MVAKAKIEECTGCGICVDECPASAIVIDNEKVKVQEDICTDCGTCVESCPNEVLTIG